MRQEPLNGNRVIVRDLSLARQMQFPGITRKIGIELLPRLLKQQEVSKPPPSVRTNQRCGEPTGGGQRVQSSQPPWSMSSSQHSGNAVSVSGQVIVPPPSQLG